MEHEQMVPLQLATERMIAAIDGAIGWITFNNPQRRNAISSDMWEAIPAIFDRFESDPAVRVIVLRGAGHEAFVAGLDITQFDQRFASAQSEAQQRELSTRANDRIFASPKPTIAMIQGFCVGAGVQIACNCDLRIAGAGARLGIPAGKLGIGYPAKSLQRLLVLLGAVRVKEMVFTARLYTAAEALAMNLVNSAVPDSDLEAEVRKTCETIAANAPLTLKAVKQSIAELSKMPSEVDEQYCDALMKACTDSEDFQEGRRAFAEKRRPVFTGR
jgi:enoyl-CoA hydratase/carnithine racemase